MTRKKLISAAMAFAVTLGTSLLALWSDVDSLGAVPPIAYVIAVTGALVGVLKDVRSSMRESKE